MSKGQRRSNREVKKPKQAKPKASVSAIAQTTAQPRPDAAARGKKKR
jgi:hypothetical protein